MPHLLETIRDEYEQARRTRDVRSIARLQEYFVPSDFRSRPFSAGVRFNPAKFPHAVHAEPYLELVSDSAVEWANKVEREKRLNIYRERLNGSYSGPIIVDEGDSWFQYPFFIDETIDHLIKNYAVYSLSGAGHLLTDMAARDEYTQVIRTERADFFLVSGGGNDLLDAGHLAEFLHDYRTGMSADDVVNKPILGRFLNNIVAVLDRMFGPLTREFPRLKILCHGYDYAIPRAGSAWLGMPLTSRGVPSQLWPDVVRVIIDAVNESYRSMETKYPGHVFHVDCRGAVGNANWQDELHPTSTAFVRIADRFLKYI